MQQVAHDAAPAYRLVRREGAAAGPPDLDDAQRAVVGHERGPLLVLAGPGTGKTTTLVEAVVARIESGVDPERVLVLTFGRKAAGELRERVTARLARTLRQPLARTFHSYAFGVLRREAARDGDPPPRLLSGPEQDLVVRELLRGELAGEADSRWPAGLRAALTTRGFAQELRDLLLRCTERGVLPEDLDALGARLDRDDWRAAARFAHRYAEVSALAGEGAYDPSGLVRAVVDRLADPHDDLAERERAAYDWVFVDEYQDTDPAQEALLRHLVPPGGDLVVVGDPDQSIYGFRGADVRCIRRFPEVFPTRSGAPAPVVRLVTCRRSAPAVTTAATAVAEGLRGPRRGAALVPVPGRAPGAVDVLVTGSRSAEAALVAGALRRAHVVDGVPWSRMAVLLRSTRGRLPVLRRAMLAAGVPVGVAAEELPLGDQPGLRPLLDVLAVGVRLAAAPAGAPAPTGAAATAVLDEEVGLALLTGPLGRLDALGLRRLRRELRRAAFAAGEDRPAAELLAEALLHPAALAVQLADLPEPVRRPAERVAALLATAAAAAREPAATAESVLWAVWEASGLGARWQAASLHGGARGAAADRDLDAVMALFDAAARFVDRLPGAAAGAFLEHLRGQEIPGDTLAARAPEGEVVRVLSAHAAKGLEWDLVVVAGVQEGVWPDLRVRGSLLGTDDVVEAADAGERVPGSRLPGLLDEERRLLYVAVTRARERLVLTAVSDPEEGEVPSRFVDDVVLGEDDAAVVVPGGPGAPGAGEGATLGALRRSLPLPALVPRLRELGVDPAQPLATRRRARALLGQLRQVTRSLDLPSLVAELRSAVLDEALPGAVRDGAAAQLARLAAAGVPGADPAGWWAALPLSDEAPLRGADEVVEVSPSRVEAFVRCELRWLLESVGGQGPEAASQAVGSLVHDVAAVVGAGGGPVTREALLAELERRWPSLDLGSPWYSAQQRGRAEAMVDRLLAWWSANGRELVAVERAFAVDLPLEGGGAARVTGRVDRLERDAQGRAHVVDLKTGSSKPRADEVGEHPQLGAYQLAADRGAFAEEGLHGAGGASLVQLGAAGGKRGAVQEQRPLDEAEAPDWAGRLVARVATGMGGAAFTARENELCERCPVRTSCPLQEDGRQVVAP
ncbi:ATP-dependent helicase [Vallicoccus soli]|uniref:DNA 3'-5' helicase n=1 Tax=Vallicoccus soli TaxID=2339232 RepID=A0A3A3Z3R9_9ACTN|nr:ATP-dependent DNA helicase [Vallicoccus soli]RJK98072.1 ATP-dependent helicase [Vallicoccus soli]